MQIKIVARDLTLTDALDAYVRTRAQRLLRHVEQPGTLVITLSVDKLVHQAEASLVVAGKPLHCKAGYADMYAAIDILADKVERMAVRHKARWQRPPAGQNLGALEPLDDNDTGWVQLMRSRRVDSAGAELSA